ncbi:hypothetical protein EVAR_58926_1 [Eumeta japonica]|uniref:Uncharacterized protein n=1 Tax=Eumeta variegata TaxID=151549 RepID=A0A4C1YB66_EUMVA|nr:hypothetical protein EVAR_58926_1 [Eumeta japonica]
MKAFHVHAGEAVDRKQVIYNYDKRHLAGATFNEQDKAEDTNRRERNGRIAGSEGAVMGRRIRTFRIRRIRILATGESLAKVISNDSLPAQDCRLNHRARTLLPHRRSRPWAEDQVPTWRKEINASQQWGDTNLSKNLLFIVMR